VRTVRSPIGLDGEYPTATTAPPLLGQHTDEVLAELGYDDSTRSALLRGACRIA
jgi:crotonobetainyl-CoA:carnitine CoA-transferase CaiB-like acyl-CoA transferase